MTEMKPREMEPGENGMDHLLRRSMSAPVPSLSPDFDLRLMRKVERVSQPLDRSRRIFLVGYGLVSVLTCAVVMRGQGLDWAPIAGMTLAPLVLIGIARSLWNAAHSKTPA